MNPAQPDASNPELRSQPERPTAPHGPAEPKALARAPAGRGPAYTYPPGSRVLSAYTIKRGVGQGGFGEVYYGISDAGKDVALKLVRRNLEVELRGVMQCLNVKHPNLISLYDVKVDDQENHWIVMEYVAGERLTDIIERAPRGLPAFDAIAIIRGIGAGVGYLHDAGIVHRDLKPANIFVENGFVKIGDYGLSKFISSSRRSGQTESVGTVHYMAPEIANGRYGKQIDIYALGVLFYELLTGKLPFDGESVGEILMKHLTAEPDLKNVSEPFRSAIAAALRKDPELRPTSVAAFLKSLDPALDLSAPIPDIAPRPLGGGPYNGASHSSPPPANASYVHGASAPRTAPAPRRSGPNESPDAPRPAKSSDRHVPRNVAPAVVAAVVLGFFFEFQKKFQAVPMFLLILAIAGALLGIAKSFRYLRERSRERAKEREAARVALQATEAFPEQPAASRFGRRAAMILGACAVAVFLAAAMTKTHRTPDSAVDPPYRSDVSQRQSNVTQRQSAISEPSSDESSSRFRQVSIGGRKVAVIGLIAIVAVGGVVGLTLLVRKSRAAGGVDALELADEAEPVERVELRKFLIDATGSLLLLFGATLVVNRLLLLLLVDHLDAPTYLWTTATTFAAVAITALTIKAMRYLHPDSTGNRLTFFAVGTVVGAASWAVADYLGFEVAFNGAPMGVKPESWPECYISGRPAPLAFIGYFGLSLCAFDWWGMTPAKRTSRWRIGDVFVAVFYAGVIHLVFPFPQPWGVLTVAGTALLLPVAFPLPPKRSARIARRQYA